MPVRLDVIEAGHAFHYTIEDPLDIHELMDAYKTERQHRDKVDHTVHAIIDATKLRRIPTNWLYARQGPGLTHPTGGEMLFVGLATTVRIIIDTILKLAQYKRIKLFKTLPEAQSYLKELLANEEKNKDKNEEKTEVEEKKQEPDKVPSS